jgi:exodeoxyribonuclease VII small subunit
MPDETEPSFEDALTELEQIVDSLERGEPALTAALAKYENGVKLLRHCYALLDRAEQAVALLTGVDEAGNPLSAPFDATATARDAPSAPPTGQTPTMSDSPARPPRRPSTRLPDRSADDDDEPPF